MEKQYSIKDPEDNQSISVLKNGKECMRMTRKGIWHLYPVVDGSLIESKLLAKDQYRSDLIERIQLGRYDAELSSIVQHGYPHRNTP